MDGERRESHAREQVNAREELIEVGDLTFRVRSTRSSRPGAEPIVLIHGVGVSHRYLDRLQTELTTTHDVYSIDLPGFGGLPKPAESLTVPAMARALAVALGRIGIGRATLIGHSMGAQWVVELVAQRPELAALAVVIGPVCDSRYRTVAAQSVALAVDSLAEPISGNALVFTDYLRCGPRWYLDQVRQMLAYRTDRRVGDLTMPLLIIRGGNDTIAGMEWCRTLRDRARTASLVTVPGHRHLVQYSAPRTVASAIREFSASHLAVSVDRN